MFINLRKSLVYPKLTLLQLSVQYDKSVTSKQVGTILTWWNQIGVTSRLLQKGVVVPLQILLDRDKIDRWMIQPISRQVFFGLPIFFQTRQFPRCSQWNKPSGPSWQCSYCTYGEIWLRECQNSIDIYCNLSLAELVLTGIRNLFY